MRHRTGALFPLERLKNRGETNTKEQRKSGAEPRSDFGSTRQITSLQVGVLVLQVPIGVPDAVIVGRQWCWSGLFSNQFHPFGVVNRPGFGASEKCDQVLRAFRLARFDAGAGP